MLDRDRETRLDLAEVSGIFERSGIPDEVPLERPTRNQVLEYCNLRAADGECRNGICSETSQNEMLKCWSSGPLTLGELGSTL